MPPENMTDKTHFFLGVRRDAQIICEKHQRDAQAAWLQFRFEPYRQWYRHQIDIGRDIQCYQNGHLQLRDCWLAEIC